MKKAFMMIAALFLMIAQANDANAQRPGMDPEMRAEFAKMAAQKVAGEYKPYEAGRKIARALESGTEFQRIAVAKNYNLENAKKIEELKVAEANINRPYRRRSDVER